MTNTNYLVEIHVHGIAHWLTVYTSSRDRAETLAQRMAQNMLGRVMDVIALGH